MSNQSSVQSSLKKLIFYNEKNKRILIIDGYVCHEKLEAIIYLKPHMVLYGIVKMICMDSSGNKIEYAVLGIDKMSAAKIKDDNIIQYKIYLSDPSS